MLIETDVGFEILSAKNPVRVDDTKIDLIINTNLYGDIPFTADKDDTEEHGRELYKMADSGDFGEVA